MKKKIKPISVEKHNTGNGIQKIYRFPNGYGASVVRFKIGTEIYGSHTKNETEWELAVIKFSSKDNDDFDIDYNTGITEDTLGYLSNKEVEKVLIEIKSLTKLIIVERGL